MVELESLGDKNDAKLAETVDGIYRTESRRILATLIRLLGDFDLAEEALQEAFAAALKQWPAAGVPANPRAWLVSTGRFKAIDVIRRRKRFNESLPALVQNEVEAAGAMQIDDVGVVDDQLRLIFTCCHPALPAEARVALTLREVCGLKTEEIAHAYLTAPATIAQRIVRAKAKIREIPIPFQMPAADELPARLDAVLQVIYLVFNEGYSASAGSSLTRPDLSGEAIRLARLLRELLPEPEVTGLLALMLLQESHRTARTSSSGDLVPLEDQDRSLWRKDLIAEGTALVQAAFRAGAGPYTLQAAISVVHSRAPVFAETGWAEIVALYDALIRIAPSPVVELNRAVAVAMRDGPAAGLALVEAILARGDLSGYHLAHAVHADLCARLGLVSEARVSYGKALALAKQETEQRFLQERLAALSA